MRLEALFDYYEQRIAPIAFIIGFTLDNLTLTRIDLYFDNVILLFFLAVASLSIFIINLYDGGALRGRIFSFVRLWAPLTLQFSLGGLFSGFTVFYFRSASLTASWLFIVFLAVLLIGNERFRRRYLHLNFHMSIFFVALFSYLIFLVPVLLGKMGAWIFLLSGAVSLLLIGLFLRVLFYFVPEQVHRSKQTLLRSIGGIFAVVTMLYFTNIIPPIPLSLKEAGVYHQVIPATGPDGTVGVRGYQVQYEDEPWYAFLHRYSRVHITNPSTLYIYSAIFAPTRLSTDIIHHWQYFDEQQDEWVTSSKIGFPISGGRDGGYRGYTVKRNIAPGWWRVTVETSRGQALGRVQFKAEEVASPPALRTDTR